MSERGLVIGEGNGIGFSSTENKLILENVKRILLTKRGERVKELEFGSSVKEYLFMPEINIDDVLLEVKNSIERELYIEREDFMEEPPKKYFRLFPGNEVRLMHAYFVKCVGFEKDENGNVTVVHCTYDPETKVGSGFTGRKVKGTIHWVPVH